MRVLLDTHVLPWALAGDARLGNSKALILDRGNDIAVSTTSYLELAIKARQGKIYLDLSQIRAAVAASGYDELPVTGAHAEPMRLVTADAAVARYSDTVIRIS